MFLTQLLDRCIAFAVDLFSLPMIYLPAFKLLTQHTISFPTFEKPSMPLNFLQHFTTTFHFKIERTKLRRNRRQQTSN